MSEPCVHVWVANSGRGGEPDFRRNRQMWFGVKMHVACYECGCRTWLSPEEWYALPGPSGSRQQRRRLERAQTKARRAASQSSEATTTNRADIVHGLASGGAKSSQTNTNTTNATTTEEA